MLLSQIPQMFKNRREKLMKKHPGAVFLLPSAPLVLRNPDVHFPFRQESNFYYLTGFDEAESFLVLAPRKSGSGSYRTILFVMPRHPEKEMWEGERYGVTGAENVFGADEAYPIEELDEKLPGLLQGAETVFYRLGQSHFDEKVLNALEKVRRTQGRSGKSLCPIADPNESIGEMRLFKESDEIDLLRKACQISAQAHRTVIQQTRPGMNEGEIEALIDYQFRKNGCERLGYGSIVAGGKNAACLHYRFNNETLKDGDLLLIDAGGEHRYYTADITRTFPVGRAFTPAQRKTYEVVLNAQKAAIAMARPGAKLPSIHEKVCEWMIEGLLSLGLLRGNSKEILKSGEYRRFYPHNTSHWLGMDVHDVGLYTKEGEPRALEPGMVFTIEPGFYVQPSDQQTPAEYQNIGIRIEDDLLITSNGCENLTHEAPKEIGEIEALKA